MIRAHIAPPNRTTEGHGNFFEVSMRSGGTILASVDQDASGTNFAMAESAPGYNDGQWHLVLVRRDNATLSLSIDGTEVASGESTSPADIANGTVLRLGGRPVSWVGNPDIYIDDFRIIDYVLSPEEEAAILALNQYPAQ